MANLKRMGSVLLRHEWDRREDWASAVHELATLSDEQIARLVRRSIGERVPSSPRCAGDADGVL